MPDLAGLTRVGAGYHSDRPPFTDEERPPMTRPITPAPTEPLSPDCRSAKHRACPGDAWDEAADVRCPCTCACHTEHRHQWTGTVGDRAMTCTLCGATEVTDL